MKQKNSVLSSVGGRSKPSGRLPKNDADVCVFLVRHVLYKSKDGFVTHGRRCVRAPPGRRQEGAGRREESRGIQERRNLERYGTQRIIVFNQSKIG